VLACDLAVIDESASLGLPEVRRGLLAAAGGVLRLQRQVPFKIAAEIALTGQPISAERARELGLVNRVAPAGTALEVTLQLAETIAANAPVSVQQTKRVMHESAAAGSDWGEKVWTINAAAVKAAFATSDALEGATAFAQKRQPVWAGK
jgi:enoyl-CoA hydratase/carnithine racemase